MAEDPIMAGGGNDRQWYENLPTYQLVKGYNDFLGNFWGGIYNAATGENSGWVNDVREGAPKVAKELLGIRDVPEGIGAPIDRTALGGAAEYDFLRAAQQAEADQAAARQRQMELADLVGARARGEGVSVAELMLRQQTDQLQNQQAGLVASQRGMNPALQRRLITQQAANAQQQMNAQGALLRAQEQQAAQALLGQQLGGMRSQDQSMYGTGARAGLEQTGMLGNLAQGDRDARFREEALRQQQAAYASQRYGDVFRQAGEIAKPIASAVTGNPAFMMGGSSPMAPGAPNTAAIPTGDYGPVGYSPAYPINRAMGGMVPGYATGGDNPKNDVVPAWLSPGEAVIPRSIMQRPDAPSAAAEFVAMLQERQKPAAAASPARTFSPVEFLTRMGK
jgi:hypothetical protein